MMSEDTDTPRRRNIWGMSHKSFVRFCGWFNMLAGYWIVYYVMSTICQNWVQVFTHFAGTLLGAYCLITGCFFLLWGQS